MAAIAAGTPAAEPSRESTEQQSDGQTSGERMIEVSAGDDGASSDQGTTAGRKIFKTKEEKRLEAEERNRISRMTRTLKAELAALEERIARLEEKKADNEKTLCGPDIHKEPQKIKQLNQDLVDIAKELENLYASWDDLTEKLAFQEAENKSS